MREIDPSLYISTHLPDGHHIRQVHRSQCRQRRDPRRDVVFDRRAPLGPVLLIVFGTALRSPPAVSPGSDSRPLSTARNPSPPVAAALIRPNSVAVIRAKAGPVVWRGAPDRLRRRPDSSPRVGCDPRAGGRIRPVGRNARDTSPPLSARAGSLEPPVCAGSHRSPSRSGRRGGGVTGSGVDPVDARVWQPMAVGTRGGAREQWRRCVGRATQDRVGEERGHERRPRVWHPTSLCGCSRQRRSGMQNTEVTLAPVPVGDRNWSPCEMG